VSEDGGVRWIDARIYVHCFRTRNILAIRYHYHLIGTYGRTEIVPCTPPESYLPEEDEAYLTEYDPYDPAAWTPSCPGSGGSGGDGDETDLPMNCRTEIIIVEVSYDEGLTWELVDAYSMVTCT
jgi:hypothetical protein